MAEAERLHEAVDLEDPSEVLMRKEEEEAEKMLIPFPVYGENTKELITSIIDDAGKNQIKWKIHLSRWAFPDYTIEQIAQMLRINRKTVMKYNKPFLLDIKDKFGMVIGTIKIGGRK